MTSSHLQSFLTPVAPLAILSGSAVGSTYVLQPSLPAIVKSFPSPYTVTLVAGAAPAGYLVGLLFMVPLSLGGRTKHYLILQAVVLAAALLGGSLAVSGAMLAITTLIAGVAATIASQAVAVAARINPDRQGYAVGIVAMGSSLGTLLGRVVGGFLSDLIGWRLTLVVFAGTLLLCAILVRWLVNVPDASGTRPRFFHLARTLPRQFRDNARLRQANIVGWCYYAPFSALWAALALHLASSPMNYGANVAGAFGILGVAGAVVVRLSGAATDRFGARRVIVTSLAFGLAGYATLYVLPLWLPALIIGTLLVDAAAFSAHTANQTSVLSNKRESDSQAFPAFTLVHSTAGIAGGAFGPALFQVGGWNIVSFGGLLIMALGLLATALNRSAPEASHTLGVRD